jgi:hypothetical protein
MNKKEQAYVESLKTQLALRWTQPVAKDLPVPRPLEGGFTSGWDFNAYNASVEKMWSESVAHGTGGRRESRISARQNGRALYSSKLLALKALRHAVECESAAKLRKIDIEIETELACQQTEGQ